MSLFHINCPTFTLQLQTFIIYIYLILWVSGNTKKKEYHITTEWQTKNEKKDICGDDNPLMLCTKNLCVHFIGS